MEQIGRQFNTQRGLESKKPIFFSKQFFTLYIFNKIGIPVPFPFGWTKEPVPLGGLSTAPW